MEHLSVVHSHPAWLVDRWLARYGEHDTEAWLRFNNEPAPLCLAVNRLRTNREDLRERLSSEGVATTPTQMASSGLVVTGGRPLTTAAFRDGHFVIQDEASQLIGELAGKIASVRYAKIYE